MRESATKKVIAESLKRRMLRHNLTDITVTDLCTDCLLYTSPSPRDA